VELIRGRELVLVAQELSAINVQEELEVEPVETVDRPPVQAVKILPPAAP